MPRLRLAIGVLAWLLLAAAAPAATITYVYDPLGRLVAVIDDPGASNAVAVYRYDSVGNLLGIDRYPATTVSLIEFSPRQGPRAPPSRSTAPASAPRRRRTPCSSTAPRLQSLPPARPSSR